MNLSLPKKNLFKKFFIIAIVIGIFQIPAYKIFNIHLLSWIILSPVDYIIDKGRNYINLISHYKNLYQKNIILNQRIVELEQELEKSFQVFNENNSLKELLNYVGDEKQKFITARLLYVNNEQYLRSALIYGGSKQNLSKGNPVLHKGKLIGRIIEVYNNHSIILFIDDVSIRIPVISSISREKAILQGSNNNSMILRHLPSDSALKEGELLVTSGDGSFYPYNLPVAIISKIENNIAYADSFLDLKSIEFVNIIVK